MQQIQEADKYSFKVTYLLVIVLALLIPKSLEERSVVNASMYSSIEIDTTLLKDGDIIFRRGISFVSNVVLEADSKSPYSHVGIISFYDETPFVIHAVPDESEKGIDYVRKDPLNLFLRTDRASAYSVIRLTDALSAQKAAAFAKKYYDSKILFDDNFSLRDTSKLYCTELVWLAFKKAGADLTNNKFDTLAIPLGENPYLLPGTILHSSRTFQVTKKSIFQ